MSDYTYPCPKCNREILELSFAGTNGYVAFCEKCQGLFYYCSIFGTMHFFKPTQELFNVDFHDLKYISENIISKNMIGN